MRLSKWHRGDGQFCQPGQTVVERCTVNHGMTTQEHKLPWEDIMRLSTQSHGRTLWTGSCVLCNCIECIVL